MSKAISLACLGKLSEVVSAQLGLHYAPDRWGDLQIAISASCRDFGFEDPEACIAWLATSPLTRQQIQTLAGHLTVGETYFFREKPSFRVLEEKILPALVAQRRTQGRRLRIWSAGCCTGEEAYSLAIAVTQAVPDLNDWAITILATDINPLFLEKAAKGNFSEWSFRDIDLTLKDRYFKRTHGRYQILPALRELVTFEYLNLAEDFPVGLTCEMDVIFCRNVMIYMGPRHLTRLIPRLCDSLNEGGWLFLGAAEASQTPMGDLKRVSFSNAIAYRKQTGHATKAPPAPAPLQPEPEAVVPTPASRPRKTAKTRPAPEKKPIPATFSAPSTSHAETNTLAERARILADKGELDEALHCCDEAIKSTKLDPALHHLRAAILQENGRLAEAAGSFKRAIYLDPDFVMGHYALGQLSRLNGNIKEAARHVHNALMLLRKCKSGDIVPESGGLTAGRLAEILSGWHAKEGRT